jgi:hypothetical protein
MGIVTKRLDRVETHLNYAGEGGFSLKPVSIYDARLSSIQMTLDQKGLSCGVMRPPCQFF